MKPFRAIPGPIGQLFRSASLNEDGKINEAELDMTALLPPPSYLPAEEYARIKALFLGKDPVPEGLATIQQVHEGLHDLRVPFLLVRVERAVRTTEGTTVLLLQDDTGRMRGYVSAADLALLEEFFPLPPRAKTVLGRGSALFLQGAALFVNRSDISRHLNITVRNVRRLIHNVDVVPAAVS
eukprot:gene31403-37960_t